MSAAASTQARTLPRFRIRDLWTLIRPNQWAKNLLVVPLALLDTPLWTPMVLLRVGWAVVAFTLASCLVFVVNDIVDRHADRRHPVKRLRPVASGRVPLPVAWLYAAGLAGLLALALAATPSIGWWPLLAYLGLNVLYGHRLKHLPLLDVFGVATGFVLRVVQGHLAAASAASEWLLTCVFALCLLLGFGKRRHELSLIGSVSRPALAGYTVQLLDYMMLVCAVVTVTGYLFFVYVDQPFGPRGPVALLASLPCALLAIFRYLQLLLMRHGGADPVRTLLGDRVMVATFAVWAAVAGVALLSVRYPVLVTWLRALGGI
jgi:4-hydroxybenzoate polyprenyltransferase